MHLEIRELSKSYWLSRVLDKIDLTLPSGKIMAVLGVNGAGKSTLLRCLATLLVPDHGQITIEIDCLCLAVLIPLVYHSTLAVGSGVVQSPFLRRKSLLWLMKNRYTSAMGR